MILLSAPVVDNNNRLVGRITVDDIVDVIRDEAEHSLMGAAGLDEEDDMFAPVVKSARRRALWLGINLITAFVAASVVDMFQTTVDKIVLLAVLMPVVPSMGGGGWQSIPDNHYACNRPRSDRPDECRWNSAQGIAGRHPQRRCLGVRGRGRDLSLVSGLAHWWRHRGAR